MTRQVLLTTIFARSQSYGVNITRKSFFFSLAVALSSRFRRNLSVTLCRFIGIELHNEESSVSLSRSIGVE